MGRKINNYIYFRIKEHESDSYQSSNYFLLQKSNKQEFKSVRSLDRCGY